MTGMRRVFEMSNEGYGRKRIVQIMLASCLFFILSGCGKTSYEVTTLEFTKDGHIIEHIVEDFPADTYDEAEWEKETNVLVDNYNSKGGSKIELKDVLYENNVLRCSLDYEDDDAYYYLNSQPIFYGTIGQAIKAGYSLLVPVYDAETKEAYNSERLKGMQDSHIIILSGQSGLKLYDKAAFVSENVELDEGRKTGSITNDNTCYIVFD